MVVHLMIWAFALIAVCPKPLTCGQNNTAAVTQNAQQNNQIVSTPHTPSNQPAQPETTRPVTADQRPQNQDIAVPTLPAAQPAVPTTIAVTPVAPSAPDAPVVPLVTSPQPTAPAQPVERAIPVLTPGTTQAPTIPAVTPQAPSVPEVPIQAGPIAVPVTVPTPAPVEVPAVSAPIPSLVAPTSESAPEEKAVQEQPEQVQQGQPVSMPSPAVAQPEPAVQQPAPEMPAQKPQAPVAQPKPTPAQRAPRAEPKEDETPMIDTINLEEPSGNWIYKRIWWERAQEKYEKIRTLVEKVFEARMIFFAHRTDLDRTLFDPFYLHAGIGRGEMEELLNVLASEMEQERAKEGMLSEDERAFAQIIQKEKEALNSLKSDIEAINKVDAAIDDALTKLMEQINLCRQYEQHAWESFKQIGLELSDKKAKELYYAMNTDEENIVAIFNYIRTPFAQHFDQLAKTAREQIERIKTTIQSLKAKGIDFKKKAEELQNIDEREEQKRRAQQRAAEIERAREEAEAEAAAANQGWFATIKNFFGSIVGALGGAVSSLYTTVTGWFGSKGTVAPEPEPATKPTLPAVPATANETGQAGKQENS